MDLKNITNPLKFKKFDKSIFGFEIRFNSYIRTNNHVLCESPCRLNKKSNIDNLRIYNNYDNQFEVVLYAIINHTHIKYIL